MKTAKLSITVAGLAFAAGFWAACSVGFDETDPANQFSCTEDSHCVSPYQCIGGICKRPDSGGNCTDFDGDGFGVGEAELRTDCLACANLGQCDEDCNDNDASIAPGLLDTCDGKDNNCDGEIDEPLPCEDFTDCPDESPFIGSCTDQVCEYRPPLQNSDECRMPAACVDGDRTAPEACF